MPTVLVIDDDPSTRDAIKALLGRKRITVYAAPDGPAGLQLIGTIAFDAVLVDMFMPGMDGVATIRELVRINATIPFIAMSGYAFAVAEPGASDLLGAVTQLGAKATLQKPFRADELFDAIELCLGTADRAAPAIDARIRYPAGKAR